MLHKDPTEFRERFLRWKKGELVYENGLALPAYEDGLTPHKKSEVNTNLATYNPEEDLYTGRYTLPEVTVTGDKSKRVYHSHAPRTSGMSKNQYKLLTGDLLGAMTTGMNVLSPSLWYGAVRDADGIQDGFNKLMRGNSGFVTENFEREHPYISAGVNLVGDAAVLGALNTIKPKPNFVPTLNSNLEGIRYAYSRNPELANIGTIEEYNDYIKTIFPESKVRDINYHMGPKGLQELKPSTGEVHNTNPGAHGIYVTPDKSYSQNLRKYTTDRLEKPSGWTYLKRNLTPGGWDKANEIFTDIYPVMVDIKNPLYTKGTWTWGFKDSKYKSLMNKYDAIVNSGPKWYQNFNSMPETIVPKTEQTLILGSDADVAGFRKFISSHKPNVVSKTLKRPVGIDYSGEDTDLLQSMITGGDVGDVADISKDLYNKNYTAAGIGAAMLAVPNAVEKPLRAIGKPISKYLKSFNYFDTSSRLNKNIRTAFANNRNPYGYNLYDPNNILPFVKGTLNTAAGKNIKLKNLSDFPIDKQNRLIAWRKYLGLKSDDNLIDPLTHEVYGPYVENKRGLFNIGTKDYKTKEALDNQFVYSLLNNKGKFLKDAVILNHGTMGHSILKTNNPDYPAILHYYDTWDLNPFGSMTVLPKSIRNFEVSKLIPGAKPFTLDGYAKMNKSQYNEYLNMINTKEGWDKLTPNRYGGNRPLLIVGGAGLGLATTPFAVNAGKGAIDWIDEKIKGQSNETGHQR